ncbi:UvrD-helicase domain-containing protein [Deltaproteobacteria bacterium TL4]
MNLDLDSLNPQQRLAVTTTHGPVLLLAGAGSGKTRVIIHRITYLVQKKKVDPESILAVTFTNKAAREMQERLTPMLNGKKGVQVSTFHSLCVKILRKTIHHLGYRPNFLIYDTQDQLSVLKTLIEEGGYEDTGVIEAKAVQFEIGQAKMLGKTPEDYLALRQSSKDVFFGQLFKQYNAVLKGCNAIDFDDILNLTLTLFEHHPEAMEAFRCQYRYVMVDEYQDTNRTQYQLIRHLTQASRNICVVGDDDQSIYGWRGADVRNILDFEKDFPEAQVIKLEQNYRSTQVILNAANQVITNNPKRMSKKLWSDKQGGIPLEWITGADETEEMQKVVDRIRLQIIKSKRQYRDYTILYRSNFQSRVIEEALREGNVPYQVLGSSSFYDRKEIKDAIAYLRVIYNPLDEVSLHRIINFPKRGIGQSSLINANTCANELKRPLFAIIKQATQHTRIVAEAAKSMESFGIMIEDYQERFNREPLDKVCHDLMEHVGFIRELEKQKSSSEKIKERRLANVYEFMRSINLYVAKNADKALKDFLERLMLFAMDDSEEETKTNQVTLMTLHSAKGLEFPYVFIVGMADEVFPNKRALDEGGEAEERRLCYVGITRAQKELTFSMAKERKRYGEVIRQEPSRFLKEIDPDLFDVPIGGQMSPEKKLQKREQSRSEFFAHLDKYRN